MKWTYFRPNRVEKISQIYVNYFNHFNLLLSRIVFTLDEYRNRNIKFTWKRKLWFYGLTSLNFFVIAMLSLISIKYSRVVYILNNWEELLQVCDFHILTLVLVIIFACIEYMSIPTYWAVRRYDFPIVPWFEGYMNGRGLRFEPKETRYILNFYSYLSYASGIVYKLGCFGLISELVMLIQSDLRKYILEEISLTEMIVANIISVSLILVATYALSWIFLMVMYLFCAILVFRVKLRKCRSMARRAALRVTCRTLVCLFRTIYTDLYRSLSLYNDAVREYWFAMEVIVKLSCTQFLIFLTNQSHVVYFTYIIVFIFAQLFLCLQLVYFEFARFPSGNLECYKQMACWNGRYQRVMNSQCILINLRHLRFHLRQNLFVQSLANNRFGFTIGTLYTMTKYKFFEMLLFNFFFLSLFYDMLKDEES